jgi:hypothetical protein
MMTESGANRISHGRKVSKVFGGVAKDIAMVAEKPETVY